MKLAGLIKAEPVQLLLEAMTNRQMTNDAAVISSQLHINVLAINKSHLLV